MAQSVEHATAARMNGPRFQPRPLPPLFAQNLGTCEPIGKSFETKRACRMENRLREQTFATAREHEQNLGNINT